MLRAVVLGVGTLCSHTRAQHAGYEPSYAEEHARPWIAAALEQFLETPIDLLQWSLARQWVDAEAVNETEAFRELCFTQLMTVAESDTTDVTLIYGAFEDGRFVGYRVPADCTMSSCNTSLLFRAKGDAPATTANWSPWTLDSVNAQCQASPTCTPPGVNHEHVKPSDVSVRTVSSISRGRKVSSKICSAHFAMIAPGAHVVADRSRSTWRAEDVDLLRPSRPRLVHNR